MATSPLTREPSKTLNPGFMNIYINREDIAPVASLKPSQATTEKTLNPAEMADYEAMIVSQRINNDQRNRSRHRICRPDRRS